MWLRWCFAVTVVAAVFVTSTRCDDDDEDDGPSTPRPPPPIPLKNMTDLVKMFGYETEEFEVTAADGQKLGLFHIKPKVAGGPVAMLQHGAGMAPDSWCIKNTSLAYLLADNGVDVWMPSSRGNVYSRKHEKFNPDKDKEFWDFSFVEMAMTDFPAVVDYILEKTKQPSLYYVGHSMGTIIALISLSQKPEYNAKIKEAVLLAPIWHCTKYQFMVNKESSMYQMVLDTWKQWDDKEKWEAFPRADVGVTDHQLRCKDLPEMATPYCEMGLDMAYSAVGDYIPAGLSVKVLKHFGQAYVTGKVLPWDFDKEELNKKAYNQVTPPDYDLKKITAKMNVFWAQADQLIDTGDVDKLINELPNVGIKHQLTDDSFNHADFVMASSPEAVPLTSQVSQKILEIVKK